MNYYGIMILILFISYNIALEGLKINGLLYQGIMFGLVILNTIILMACRKYIKWKGLMIIICFLMQIFSKDLLQLLFVFSNMIILTIIEYNELRETAKFNFQFKLIIACYILSILSFLVYLRFEYDPKIGLNYFIRLFIIIIASMFIMIGNKIYGNNYVEKIEDKKKITKFSQSIVFIYYTTLLFNMVVFARYHSINSYNFISLKSIIDIFKNGNLYSITINILGNFVIFMPLEYFMIELFKINKVKLNFIISFIIILMIEVFQFIFKIGAFDIDDILLCTLGMMIFYMLYNKFKKANFISH